MKFFEASILTIKALLNNLSTLSALSYLKKTFRVIRTPRVKMAAYLLRFDLMADRISRGRRGVVIIVALVMVAATFPLAAFLTAQPAKAAWYNDDWHYRKSILFTHSGAESNVYLNLSGANALDTSASGRYQSDCGDLRFTDGNGSVLNYFLVSGCGTSTTVVHVLYGTMPAGDQYLYVYYGNPSVANGTTNFDFSTAATGITFGSVGAEETSQGPVAEWKFDGNLNDSSTNRYNATNGMSSILTPKYVTGVSGQAIDFSSDDWGTTATSVSTTVIQDSSKSWTTNQWAGYSFLTDYGPNSSYCRQLISSNTANQLTLSGTCSTWTGNKTYRIKKVPWVGQAVNYGTQNITATVWFKNSTPKADTTANTIYRASGDDFALESHSGYIAAWIGSFTNSFSCTANGTDQLWHYAALSYDGATARLYYDGRLCNTRSQSTTLANNQTIMIGTRNDGYQFFYEGTIDDLQIYNYTRTQQQVQEDYAAGLTSMNSNGGNLSNGLVGYWKMDEASWNGSVGEVKDSSGSGNNGQAFNAPNTTPGKFGQAGSFGATNNTYVKTTTNVALAAGQGRAFSFWIYPNSAENWAGVFIPYVPNSFGAILYYGTTGFITDRTCNNDTLFGATPTPNQWNHIVFTYDPVSKNQRAYVNGILKSTVSRASTGCGAFAANPMYIGNNGAGTSALDGKLDELRYYNRNITATEVQQLYNYGPPPVAAYNFEEDAGTTVNDVTGNGNTGTWSGTGNHWTPGKIGIAGNLNGTDDTVAVANNSALNFDYNQDFSVGFWVKDGGGNASTANTILEKWGGSGAFPYSFRADTNSTCFRRYDGTNTAMACDANIVLTDQKWHFVMGTKTGSTLSIYVDGQLEGTGTDSTTTTTTDTSSLYFGSRAGSSLYYKGSLDQIRIYNYGRSQGQMLQDMNSTASALDSPVGWWKMDEGHGTTANNSGVGGSALNGTLSNMAAPATSTSGWTSSGKNGDALNFDGTDDVVSVSNLDTTFFSRSFTVSAWAMRSDSRTQHAILSYSSMGSPLAPVDFALRGSNAYVQLNDSSGTTTTIQKGTTTTNKWYYLTVAYDASASLVSLYMNGSLLGTATVASPPRTSSGALTIGRDAWNGTMLGSIDEVKIWGSALSSQDILADYNRAGSVKVGSAGTENVTTKSGATGTQPSNSKNSEYCVPGDTSSCSAPVGEWKFEEGSGTTVADSSGSGNSGTWGGTGNHWVPGKFGTAGNFNGSDDYVNAGTGSSLQIGTGSMTVGLWFKGNAPSTGQTYLIDTKYCGSNGAGFYVAVTSTLIVAVVANGTAQNSVTTSITPYTDGKWHYLVFSLQRGATDNKFMYVDGQLKNSNTNTAGWDLTNSNEFDIGRGNCAGSSYYTGSIDQVRLYNYARTPAQIAWDFNKDGPVAWYKMDECSGSTVHSSTNPYNSALNGTITIGATGTQTAAGTCQTSGTAWGNGASGKRGASLNFDGTDDYVTSPFDIDSTNGVYTMSAWIKSSASNVQVISTHAPSVGYSEALQLDSGSIPNMCTKNTSNTSFCTNSTKSIADGKFHQLVGTVDWTNLQIKVYVDGVLSGTGAPSGTRRTDNDTTYIGRRADGGSYVNGQIDDVQIFNYALTPTQISTLYNGGSMYWGQ